MGRVTFRFYEELNDFLAPSLRRRELEYPCAPGENVKHAIEALGVPHTEVEVILVNGESVGFECPLYGGERVAVYPVFEAFDVTPLLRLRDRPLRTTRFIADVHLGRLAAWLRMAGFDTLFESDFEDARIAEIAASEGRIVLTRDRKLLERRAITHGCYLHATTPEQQLRELFGRLDLARSVKPFTRCTACNAPLRAADKDAVAARVPHRVLSLHDRFSECSGCGRVYWEGSHWRRVRDLLEQLCRVAADR